MAERPSLRVRSRDRGAVTPTSSSYTASRKPATSSSSRPHPSHGTPATPPPPSVVSPPVNGGVAPHQDDPPPPPQTSRPRSSPEERRRRKKDHSVTDREWKEAREPDNPPPKTRQDDDKGRDAEPRGKERSSTSKSKHGEVHSQQSFVPYVPSFLVYAPGGDGYASCHPPPPPQSHQYIYHPHPHPYPHPHPHPYPHPHPHPQQQQQQQQSHSHSRHPPHPPLHQPPPVGLLPYPKHVVPSPGAEWPPGAYPPQMYIPTVGVQYCKRCEKKMRRAMAKMDSEAYPSTKTQCRSHSSTRSVSVDSSTVRPVPKLSHSEGTPGKEHALRPDKVGGLRMKPCGEPSAFSEPSGRGSSYTSHSDSLGSSSHYSCTTATSSTCTPPRTYLHALVYDEKMGRPPQGYHYMHQQSGVMMPFYPYYAPPHGYVPEQPKETPR